MYKAIGVIELKSIPKGVEAADAALAASLFHYGEYTVRDVKEYLSGQGGYEYLGKKYSMRHKIIQNWVANYKRFGEEGDSEEQKELLKQLQEENLRLRIENAFLKEARRLRLEEEALLKKQRESSTASEENSN